MRYLAWKRETRLALVDDPVLDFHFTLQRFAAVLSMYGPDFTAVVERRSTGVRLALVCLDPARSLAPISKQASSTVLLSATLNPPEAIRRVLGLESARTSAIALPPPFPPENRKVMIVPSVPDDLHGPRAELRTNRRAARRDVRRARRQRPGSLSLVPLPDGRRSAHARNPLAPSPAALRPERLRAPAASRIARVASARRHAPLRGLRRNVRGRCGLSGRPALGRLRGLAGASPGLLRARASAAVLRGKRRGGLRLRVPPARHDPRRAGGGPAHPQRARPRGDRPSLRALSRGALREPAPPRLVRRKPERARDAEAGRRDPGVFREVRMTNPYTKKRMPRLTVDSWVRDRRGRVLLVQRARPPFEGRWGLPGGFCEWKETTEACCARETLEETGLRVKVGELLRRLLEARPRPARPQRHRALPLPSAFAAGSPAATTRPTPAGSRRGRSRSSASRSITARSCRSSSPPTDGGAAGAAEAAALLQSRRAFGASTRPVSRVAANARVRRPSSVTAQTVYR